MSRVFIQLALDELLSLPRYPFHVDAEIDLLRDALAMPDEPVAWAHPDGRVIAASTMDAAKQDGGAMLSSLRGYTIPLYAEPKTAIDTAKPLPQGDIDAIIHASRACDEGPTQLLRRLEHAHGITGEQT